MYYSVCLVCLGPKPGIKNKNSYSSRPVESQHHNNSCVLVPLIAWNLLNVNSCNSRGTWSTPPLGSMVTLISSRYITDPGLRLFPYSRTILIFCPSSCLDFRAYHGTTCKEYLVHTRRKISCLLLKCVTFPEIKT